MSLFRNVKFLLLSIVFLLYLLIWLYLNLVIQGDNNYSGLFTDSYGIIAALGGIIGISISKNWGGTKSVIGKAILAFSFGLIFNFLGQLSYAIYHQIYKVENPYPSFGDIFYIGNIFLYIVGGWLIATAAGSKTILKTFISKKIIAIFFPIIMVLTSYTFFLRSYEFNWENPTIIFLDFGYPIGPAIYVSIAILAYYLSKDILGGIMKNRVILIIVALVLQYISDTVFMYRTFQETWQPAGISDLLYIIAYFLMSVAILQFDNIFNWIKSQKK